MIDQTHTAASDALTVARLATLTPGEYDRVREAEAERLRWRVSTLDAEVQRARIAAHDVNGAESDRPPEFSDEALALRFTARHADNLRHVARWGRWLEWDGTVWRFDDTHHAFDRARAICREAAASCNDPRVAPAIASAKAVAAVERLAKADRRHATEHDAWDADPWLLNTPGGVVNLRTGQTRPPRPDDCMTKITAVGPGDDCPLWLRFLKRITADDVELQAFLQRMAGYALTGSTKEHAVFFGFGTGANGKGTFVNTLTAIMGGYAAVAQMDTFTASAGDRHPADLAMLRGARLVTAQETEEGRRWAESKIKALTGGDPITARFMRQDFFTFTPHFKLLLIGNHKPALRNVDEAIRRRFHLIPFEVRIPPEERDTELAEKLMDEWPGILQWAIDGCLDWQREMLAPPYAVIQATGDYLEAEDAMGQWLIECCEQQANVQGLVGHLFASWRKWADGAGEYVGSQKRFSQALLARGFKPHRDGNGRAGFIGLAAVRSPAGAARDDMDLPEER